MKTAEEVLVEIDQAVGLNDSRTLFEWEDVVKAMKVYANQKLDEAAEKVFFFEISNWSATASELEQCVLKFKDNV